MIELLFGILVAVGLPLRAWRRRHTSSRPMSFLLESALRTAILTWLLWRNGVTLAALGLSIETTWAFALHLALCLLVVVGPDAWSARRIATAGKHGAPLPAPDPLFLELSTRRYGVATFVAMMLLAAIWEELCFRGTVFLLLPSTVAGRVAGLIGGSLLFAAQHLRMGVRRASYTAGFGMMFAGLYLITGDLLAVIIAHATGNILSGLWWAPQVERLRRARAASTPVFIG
jgi:membrane protease YdiL (CAAX protease family)